MTIKIREIRHDEAEILSKVAIETYLDTFSGLSDPDNMQAHIVEKKSPAFFRQMIATGKAIFLGAFETSGDVQKLVGYIGLCESKDNVKGRQPTKKDRALMGFYVLPSYQNKKIGKSLLDSAFEHDYFKGSDYVYLGVWDKNKIAYDFYLKYGFEIVGTYEFIVDGKVIDEDTIMICAVDKNKRPKRKEDL